MDIHNREKRLESARENFQSYDKIGEDTKDLVEEFLDDYGTRENLSLLRKAKYYQFFKRLYQKGFLSTDLDKITKQDVIKCLRKISESDYAESTKKDTAQRMPKTFYNWFRKAHKEEVMDDSELYDAVEYWREYTYKKDQNKVDEKQSLTLEEIEKLLKACRSTRDKAFVMTMAESGCRIEEMLNVRLEHLDTESWKNGYVMKITKSKTKKRKIPLYKSVPYLSEWLEEHPYKEDPGDEDAFLWTMRGDRPMSYAAARKLLKVLKDRADLDKPLTPHILRHTAATLAGNEGWNEYQMQDFFGWSRRSDVAGQYVHKIDLKKVVEEKNDIRAVEDEEADKRLEPKNCPVCHETNPATNEYCINCYRPLDAERLHSDFDKLANDMSDHPEKIKKLLEFISAMELDEIKKHGKESLKQELDQRS